LVEDVLLVSRAEKLSKNITAIPFFGKDFVASLLNLNHSSVNNLAPPLA